MSLHSTNDKLESEENAVNTALLEDEVLAHLAQILVEAYFEQRKYARTNQTIH